MDKPDHKNNLLPFTSTFEDKNPIELSYHVRITAKIKKSEDKVILHDQVGVIPQESFTAVLGPSGSGKTSFLNFLAGRLMSDNLQLEGEYKINGQSIKSMEPFSNQIGYVMQEDALLGMLTPKESLMFAASMKLKLCTAEREERVEELIEELGLKLCQDTKIGNTFIKGVSGGERKRTSIGLELITNPNIIFLDEPTTGLDSTTALQVIQLLSNLCKKGKTIVSTIHQPSSELFCEFDRLMLLVEGRCIYSGDAQGSYAYFERMGYTCPELMNASEFYLDLMSFQADDDEEDSRDKGSEEQRRASHNERILKMEYTFKNSDLVQDLKQNENLQSLKREKRASIPLITQLWLIFYRALICQLRNPMDVTLKVIQSIFTAIIVIIVFGKIDNTSMQNLRGVVFFLVSQNAFGGIQGTLATFSLERPVFIRQRYSKTYSTFTYFISRTLCSFPFDVTYPTISASIVYWATGMGNSTMPEYLRVLYTVNSTYFLSASYGLLYSTIISRLETAMALVPVLIIPFMLLGGFFIDDVTPVFYPIMYLSPFKYGFQAIMLGLGSPFGQKYHPATFEDNIWCIFGIALAVRVISLIGMQIVSSPRRPKLRSLGQVK